MSWLAHASLPRATGSTSSSPPWASECCPYLWHKLCKLAGKAFRVYGRGTGRPAALDYGDTFAYALAIDLDEPLLFVGTDFAQTDVRVAQVL